MTVSEDAPARGSVAALLWPAFGLLLVVAAWWGATVAFDLQSFILPSPGEVVSAFGVLRAELLRQTWSTTVATLLGFGLSVLVAVLIGAAIAAWRPIERMFQPLLVAFNA